MMESEIERSAVRQYILHKAIRINVFYKYCPHKKNNIVSGSHKILVKKIVDSVSLTAGRSIAAAGQYQHNTGKKYG